MAIRPFPARPLSSRPRLRLLRSQRGWWTRFMDPRELFGLKVAMLACCFGLSGLLGP